MPMPIFTAGRRLRASELKAMADQINSLTAPGWTPYTPVWSSSGTAPALGNGVLTGRSRRPAGSDLIEVEIRLVMGSTTTFGTGFYSFTVPANPSATSQNTSEGVAYFTDTTVLDRAGFCRFSGNLLIMDLAAGGLVSNTVPHTWGSTDVLRAKIQYEPA